MKAENWDASLVIPTIGRVEELRECLFSVFDQNLLPLEIIVVDASSDDGVENLLKGLGTHSERTGIEVIYLRSTEANVCVQRNLGVDRARGRYVWFLDDDVVVRPDYLEITKVTFDEYPEAAGVGGFINSDGLLDSSVKFLFQDLFLLNRHGAGAIQKSGYPSFPVGNEDDGAVRTRILGGCSCYRKNAITEIGGFDEQLGVTKIWDDVDFTNRLSEESKLFYQPRAKLHHKKAPSGRMPTSSYIASYLYNHYYLFRRHVEAGPTNFALFLWSHLGTIFYLSILGLVKRDVFSGLKGVFVGNFWILKGIIFDWEPNYDDVGKK